MTAAPTWDLRLCCSNQCPGARGLFFASVVHPAGHAMPQVISRAEVRVPTALEHGVCMDQPTCQSDPGAMVGIAMEPAPCLPSQCMRCRPRERRRVSSSRGSTGSKRPPNVAGSANNQQGARYGTDACANRARRRLTARGWLLSRVGLFHRNARLRNPACLAETVAETGEIAAFSPGICYPEEDWSIRHWLDASNIHLQVRLYSLLRTTFRQSQESHMQVLRK